MTIKSKEEFQYKNSLFGLIGGFISIAISIGLRENLNQYVSNNYLWRFGTRGKQEKTKGVDRYQTVLKTKKSYNQLCHFKRQQFSYLRGWKT